MVFWVREYSLDERGKLSPLDPQPVRAETHREAGQTVCQIQLIEAGPDSKLAVEVWPRGHPSDIKRFYRP